METIDYQNRSKIFLDSHGLEFHAVLVGSDCPTFCKDAETDTDMDKLDTYPRRTHIHGKHYRCTISGKDRGHVSFDMWNSYSDEEFNYVLKHPGECSYPTSDRVLGKKGYIDGCVILPRLKQKARTPKPYDLLACIQKYDVGTLRDFCSDFGYDEDSKRADAIYVAVCKEYQKVRKFFTEQELTLLQEIQ